MTTVPVQAAHDALAKRAGVKSKEASAVAYSLLNLPVEARRRVIKNLSPRELGFVLLETQRETGSMFGLWVDTPSGFVEDVLGETIWSKQREIIDAIPRNKRTAVPAGFGVGKTWASSRAVLWFTNVYPAGTAQAVTIAPRFRQVRNQLWPHIRKVVKRADLPGHADTVQYKIPDANGVDTIVAYGFSAPENDESAMQGVHSPRLLVVVEEAGGIPKAVGEGTNNLLTGDARLFAIGNPASDDPGSWFESLCEEGWSDHKKGTETITIATPDSPAITGELTPICQDCRPNHDGHRIADLHMPDQEWMDRTIDAYGEDHPYVVAKVYARFPKDAGIRVIPASWVDAAAAMEEPAGAGYGPLRDLGIPTELREFGHDKIAVPGEVDRYVVKRGAWVRLGIDVAADGGDEFAIFRAVGDLVHMRHVSSGAQNHNAVTVAEVALGEILAAERLAKALGTTAPVHVKVDTIGVGWGVVGMLERWGKKGPGQRHTAKIVPVNVAESPENTDEGAAMRPYRKRDELWLSGRLLMQPDKATGETRIRLRVDDRTKAQLAVPAYTNNSAGFVVVESKKSMKSRGRNSPDRAEAALLALYEPGGGHTKRRGILNG